MPGGRRGRLAVMLLCGALGVGIVVVYFASGAVRPAKSARTADPSGVDVRPEQVRALPRAPSRSASVSADKQARKAVHARRRPTAYRIAFFGDSVSVGFGASDRKHGYVAHVLTWLDAHGKRSIGTVDAKGGVPVAYWEYAEMPRHLHAAVVELGTNDVRLGTSSAQFASEYRVLTSRIRAANPSARLLCVSVWPRPGDGSLESVINAQIRAACPGAYVDVTGLGGRPGIRSSDGFHPNDLGYRLIARAVESKLKTS